MFDLTADEPKMKTTFRELKAFLDNLSEAELDLEALCWASGGDVVPCFIDYFGANDCAEYLGVSESESVPFIVVADKSNSVV